MLDKIWDDHLVAAGATPAEPDLVYVDMHYLHEITSPQAFGGLAAAGRAVRRPDLTFATEDHNVPTDGLGLRNASVAAREQIIALRRNAGRSGVHLAQLGAPDQGIVHVIGPEQGLSQPGSIIVCGDSHTSTHGALGALAFGIGTSDVEHVLATQTIRLRRPRSMLVELCGRPRARLTSKDLALNLLATLGTSAGQGFAIEYRGEVVTTLSTEARMTLCNMTIELGARAGMIAPDTVTLDYLRARPFTAQVDWDEAAALWLSYCSDEGAAYDRHVQVDVSGFAPFVTWGTNPAQGVPISGFVPDPASMEDGPSRAAAERALDYMGLAPGTAMRDIRIDSVFLGSCTNSRIEDLLEAAEVLVGRRVAEGVRMLVVPGSEAVKRRAEELGLDAVFRASGAQWRSSGCSLCVGLNNDVAARGERIASTSNRNFEGRQGAGARTHLVAPRVAAATAVAGRLASPEDLERL
ncbi:3-isopropylmalate dehydratase large subunit [Microbacterium sp. No. 7]|uniref:3-isopropylmalate dehydratase large subunit n=1 Tax=Microbacterium sp. No. 7 TaxID=1714373 RepID=UPI001E355F87|nr:3-isopropylmalate dehydratase large subunit [Microbacterium sp. No. 7]